MLYLERNGKYADVMERALYNGVLAGMQLDGTKFFYVNPLEVLPGISGEAKTHKHALPVRPKWFACACCPPNVARLLASVAEYAWHVVSDTLFSNLFIAGTLDLTDSLGGKTVFSFGICLAVVGERLLQSTGRTIYNMITQGLGAIINIILDPILIFGLWGVPRMEVLGAAVATVVGQICGMALSLFFNVRKNQEINLNMKGFRPDWATIRKIYEVGLPSIIMQSIGSVMVFGVNKILMMFTSTAVSVFGVYFKLQSFIFMPVFGLNNGMVPIIAYNYGARRKKRITETVKLSIGAAVAVMLAGLAVFQLRAEALLEIFDASPDMLSIGVPALRTISLSFLFAGYCIVVGSVFQALGNGVYSLAVSVARQILVILPVAYVFARLWGLNAVWWSIPIAEIVSVVMSTVLLRRIYRLRLAPLEATEAQT